MKIKTRRYYVYYLLKTGMFIIGILPRKIAMLIAGFLGKCAYASVKKYREISLDNLRKVLGDEPERNALITKTVFMNLAKNAVDWIKLSFCDKKYLDSLISEVTGIEHMEEALKKGKGLIFLGSHFGNWELLPMYFYSRGYKGAVMARRIYFHKYDKFIMRMRNKFGAKMVYRDSSPKDLLKMLKRGEVLGMIADQDIDSVEGVFVDFFWKPAYTSVAPVKLALATGAPLMPGYIVRKKDDTYKIVLEKPIELVQGENKEKDVKKYTQLWSSILEKYIREYPDQWVWIHRRWKTERE